MGKKKISYIWQCCLSLLMHLSLQGEFFPGLGHGGCYSGESESCDHLVEH